MSTAKPVRRKTRQENASLASTVFLEEILKKGSAERNCKQVLNFCNINQYSRRTCDPGMFWIEKLKAYMPQLTSIRIKDYPIIDPRLQRQTAQKIRQYIENPALRPRRRIANLRLPRRKEFKKIYSFLCRANALSLLPRSARSLEFTYDSPTTQRAEGNRYRVFISSEVSRRSLRYTNIGTRIEVFQTTDSEFALTWKNFNISSMTSMMAKRDLRRPWRVTKFSLPYFMKGIYGPLPLATRAAVEEIEVARNIISNGGG